MTSLTSFLYGPGLAIACAFRRSAPLPFDRRFPRAGPYHGKPKPSPLIGSAALRRRLQRY